MQGLVVLWMTRNITDNIPGWGVLFHNKVGDGTVTVSAKIITKTKITELASQLHLPDLIQKQITLQCRS